MRSLFVEYDSTSLEEIVKKMRVLLTAEHSLHQSEQQIEKIRKQFIVMFEGCKNDAYDDRTGQKIKDGGKNGCVTIGCGFNMSRDAALEEWKLAELNEEMFAQAYEGELALTTEQVAKLLDVSLSIREAELMQKIPEWKKLPIYVRIGLESAYYNSPRIFKVSELLDFINLFLHTDDGMYLKRAGEELAKYKHTVDLPTLRNRRQLEALMICGELFL